MHALPRLQLLQSQQVRLGQVVDMDVIAHAGAVRRRVIAAEHLDMRPQSHRGEDRERDQMRLGVVVLADRAACIRPGGIEIP